MSWFRLSQFKYWPQTLVLLLLAAGYGCYRYFAYYDTHSSDAYVTANIVNIAPQVTGPVTAVYVKDNQKVGAGEKLFAIEPQPFTHAVEQARAKRNASDALFALIESKKWWIETRYRETAIRLIKPGDKALIKIDMYPGKTFHGHVASIGWGINRVQAGNVASSSLVYLQPTEDWIQIAQRFPVQIEIDDASDEYPLRVGASAATTTYR